MELDHPQDTAIRPSNMSLKQLREECASRSLSIHGNKRKLMNRLKCTLEREKPNQVQKFLQLFFVLVCWM